MPIGRIRTLCGLGLCLTLLAGVARAGEQNQLPPAPDADIQRANAELPPEPIAVGQDLPPKPVQTDEITPAAKQESPASNAFASPPVLEAAKDFPVDTSVRIPEFIGDQSPIGSLRALPSGQIGGTGAVFVPSVRYFKISDNDSPRPQDRSYFSFNYFYDLNGKVNQALGGGIQHTRIHREIWGWEWANKAGDSSFGLRLPLTTFNAAHTIPGLDGTSTDIGDLAIIWKQVLWQDHDKGHLFSAGLAVIPPTGPGSFAGSSNIQVFHNTCLQPFCGWIWSHDRFYLQGFTAVDAPTDLSDVVMLSNDLAAGYFLLQKGKDDGLIAVVPTVEVHFNTPLNHRGVLALRDPAGNPDSINVTGGVHFEYGDRSSMAVGFALPVTGPRMFDFEILAQFRWRY